MQREGRARCPYLANFAYFRAVIFALHDFAAEKLPPNQAPIDVSDIPESIRGALPIQLKIEGFNRPNQATHHTDTIHEVEIDFGQHPIRLIDPDSPRGFVDKTIFEAMRGQ